MFQSSKLWFWRRATDCFATIGILAFLMNSSLSDKFFDEISSESSKSLTSKLFESVMLRFIKMCSGCIFNVVFDTMYFRRRFLRKCRHCFQWLRDVFIHSPLMFFTVLYSWADNIYVLCWFKMIQVLFTLIESVKSEVIFRIGKANLAMMVFASTSAKIHQEYHFYYIPPFVMFIATFNVIRTCLKLIVSLIALSAITITESCFAVIFDFIHMPCPAPKNQWRLDYLMYNI
ncbi:hypothetical protein AVEN_122903-1 [Araneus ventricosus]|uniref:Uncharacterized protein n=1 Tax=Araneus ventricosus TaxID=182803 RepID=A0A4Y2MTP8_ARAVE|nr:hypothetical protein AVEN_122903-1 [Araneus ventricosus]